MTHIFTTESSSAIVLASASPRRRELLERVGLTFSVVPSTAPEELLTGETPEEHVLRLSEDKAREVAGRDLQPGRYFIGSDTIVLLDDLILGKPKDHADAATMLRALSGKQHRVLSGFAVFDRQTGTCRAQAVSTKVTFKRLREEEIAGYIATGEPTDKAGAYAIQGIGTFMVKSIEGSYSNVVGLPLTEVLDLLEEIGAARPFPTRREA
jgi:septum formation protein